MAIRQQPRMPASLAEIVDEGLSHDQKALPSFLFYDEIGSPLFEEITGLPEYYLTACETDILQCHSREIIDAVSEADVMVIEFASGSSQKTRLIIEAIIDRQGELTYAPIDISEHFLARTAAKLEAAYEGLTVRPIAKEYFEAIH